MGRQLRWTGTPQESPRYGALVPGAVVENVDVDTAALWLAAGVAEAEDTGAKRRRAAAPEPAPEG
jgi:hypothetical protein